MNLHLTNYLNQQPNSSKLSELNDQMAHIFSLKNYCASLNKRLSLVKENYYHKTDNEKNEVDILTHETLVKIIVINQKIKKLEQNFWEQYNHFLNQEN